MNFLNFIINLFCFFVVIIGFVEGDTNESLKIGFIYYGSISDFGWSYAHDQGRIYLADTYPSIYTDYIENVPDEQVADVARNWVDAGYDLIVGTSYGHQFGLLDVALESLNKSVKFLAVSGDVNAPNLANGFAKIYQARYLAGLVAGLVSKSKHICYIGAWDIIPEVIYSINAFTIGVREVAADSMIYVYIINTWSNQSLEAAAGLRCFTDHPESDMITQHSDNTDIQKLARDLKKYSLGYDSDMRIIVGESVLTSAVFHWGPLYKIFTDRIINSSLWKPGSNEWWGIDKEMIGIAGFSNRVPYAVRQYVLTRQKELVEGKTDVFCNDPHLLKFGNFTKFNNTCLGDSSILSMLQYVDGVEFCGYVALPPIKENFLLWEDPVTFVFVIIASLWLCYAVVMLVITIIKREHPVIKGISFLFCVLMQVSGILSCVTVFVWPGKPTLLKCNVIVWLIGIGFIIFYSCLLAKTWRVWKLFAKVEKLKKQRPLTDNDLLIKVVTMTLLEVIILLCFSIISPLRPMPSDNPLLEGVDIICESENSRIFIAILIAYKAVLLLAGTVMAFLTRKISKHISESREIYWVIYTILLLNIMILPIVFTLNITPQVRYSLVAADVMWILTFSFSVLFARRLYLSLTLTEDQAIAQRQTSFRKRATEQPTATGSRATQLSTT